MGVWDYTAPQEDEDLTPSPTPAESGIWSYSGGGSAPSRPTSPQPIRISPGRSGFILEEPQARARAESGMTPGGLVKNIAGGVQGLARGVSDILIGGAQDVVGILQGAVPGSQSLENRYVTEGSRIAEIIVGEGDKPSLSEAFVQDLTHRYGPLFEGDVDKFVTRIYEAPVSFAIDVASVGAVAKAPFAAAERLSAISAAKTAGIPYSEARAAAVAGRTGTTRAVLGPGSREYASWTSVAGKTVNLPSNPVTRVVKETILKAVSSPIDESFAKLEATGVVDPLVAEARRLAGVSGTERVFKPWFSKSSEFAAVQMMTGIKRSRVGQYRAQALAEFDSALGPKNSYDPAVLIEQIQGSHSTTGVSGIKPVEFRTRFDVEVAPPVSVVDDAMGLDFFRRLQNGMGRGVRAERFYTPHSTEGARYAVTIPDVGAAEGTLLRAADSLGGTLVGVRNYLPEKGPWRGIHGFVDVDGQTVEISVGTEKMFRAQEVAGRFLARRNDLLEEVGGLFAQMEDLKAAGDVEGVSGLLDRVEFLAKEQDAMQVYTQSLFEGPTREARGFVEKAGLDNDLAKADNLRVWEAKWLVEPELDHGLTFQTVMNRAYGPQRLSSFMYDLAHMEDGLRSVFAENTDAVAVATVMDALTGFPRNLVSDVVDFDALAAAGTPEAKAALVTSNLRNLLRENVVNGDVPGYTWQEMHAARMQDHLPTPHYYPHISIANHPMSDLARTGGRSWTTTEPPNIRERWMGHLMERGTFIRDPVNAYTRVFNSISKHHETIRYLDEVLDKFGHEVSDLQVAVTRATGNMPEKFINPQAARAEISFRAMLEAQTYEFIREGKTIEAATQLAIEKMMPDITRGMIQASTGKVMAVPSHIAKTVERELGRTIGWKSRVFWDAPMAVWRASVLSFRPGWILNNTVGNLVFTGLRDPGAVFYAIRQMSKKQRDLLEYLVTPERLADIERGFSKNLPHRYHTFSDEAVAANPGLARLSERVSEAFPSRGFRAVSQYARQMNSRIEEAFRRGIYLSKVQRDNLGRFSTGFARSKIAMDRLAREGITDTAHNSAVVAVDRTLGNYTNLTPIEQDVIRRWVAPFWAFYRHVGRYVARMPIDHPMSSRVLELIDRVDSDMEKYLPEWLQNAAIVGEFSDGVPMFVNFHAANPLNSPLGIVEGPLANLNPVAKVVLEHLGIKRNIFTGKEFTEEGVIETRDGTKWRVFYDESGRLVGRPEPLTGDVLPPWWRHIMTQFPQYNVLEKIWHGTVGPGYGGQYSGSGRVITAGGKPVFPSEPWTIVTNYLGIPFYRFDVEGAKNDYLASQAEAESVAAGRIP